MILFVSSGHGGSIGCLIKSTWEQS
jgi:hypothetical protein